jgi:hypothetical protein
MAKLLDVDQLSTEAMLTILEIFDEVEEERKEDALIQLREKTLLIEAKKRRGKTLTAMAISWELRERFKQAVVVVGSNMGLKPVFGPAQFMTEAEFRQELENIAIVANEAENAEQVAKAFEKYGIKIYGATIVFDEARKLFNRRAPMDKLCQLFADYLMQSSHYHTTNILTAPEEQDIDRRVCKQIDWRGRVYHNKYTNIARCRFTQGVETLVYEVNGASDTEHIPFYDMYDSWSLLGFRQRALSIKQI